MTQNNPQPGGEVALFEAPDGQIRLDVRLERDTVWLTQSQIADLDEESNVQILHILRKSGFPGISAGDRTPAKGFGQLLQKMQQLPPMERASRLSN